MNTTADTTALLELLGNTLVERGWHAELQQPPGRRIRLHVRNPRVSRLNDDIFCDGEKFMWGHGQGIGPVTEVAGVAERIQYVLREVGS